MSCVRSARYPLRPLRPSLPASAATRRGLWACAPPRAPSSRPARPPAGTSRDTWGTAWRSCSPPPPRTGCPRDETPLTSSGRCHHGPRAYPSCDRSRARAVRTGKDEASSASGEAPLRRTRGAREAVRFTANGEHEAHVAAAQASQKGGAGRPARHPTKQTERARSPNSPVLRLLRYHGGRPVSLVPRHGVRRRPCPAAVRPRWPPGALVLQVALARARNLLSPTNAATATGALLQPAACSGF